MNPLLTINADGLITEEGWWVEGKCHRVDGPAWREWKVVNGVRVLTYESWYLQGKLHRVDDPAYRVWEIVNGQPVLTWDEWFLTGVNHRVDGPARINWEIVDGHPVLIWEEWYLQGKEVDPADLHRAAVTIQRWFLHHRNRRERIISSLLQADGMTVFPGLMQLLRQH